MIDFVITWLDDSDPNWIAERNRAIQDLARAQAAVDPVRFRDWGLLKYWFRSVEQHAPWVNRIHLVTPTRVPEWLRVEHPKLQIVDANQLNPFTDRPTFSSHAVEANLHRIPGLAEQFVYFNDDIFIVSDITPEFFFRNGLPKLVSSPYPLSDGDSHSHALLNVSAALNARHSRSDLFRNGRFAKHLSWRNGRDLARTIPSLLEQRILPLKDPHLAAPLLATDMARVADLYSDEFARASREVFRTSETVAPVALATGEAILLGRYEPTSSRSRGRYCELDNVDSVRSALESRNCRSLCINDSDKVDGFDARREVIKELFIQQYPIPSAVEYV